MPNRRKSRSKAKRRNHHCRSAAAARGGEQSAATTTVANAEDEADDALASQVSQIKISSDEPGEFETDELVPCWIPTGTQISELAEPIAKLIREAEKSMGAHNMLDMLTGAGGGNKNADLHADFSEFYWFYVGAFAVFLTAVLTQFEDAVADKLFVQFHRPDQLRTVVDNVSRWAEMGGMTVCPRTMPSDTSDTWNTRMTEVVRLWNCISSCVKGSVWETLQPGVIAVLANSSKDHIVLSHTKSLHIQLPVTCSICCEPIGLDTEPLTCKNRQCKKIYCSTCVPSRGSPCHYCRRSCK